MAASERRESNTQVDMFTSTQQIQQTYTTAGGGAAEEPEVGVEPLRPPSLPRPVNTRLSDFTSNVPARAPIYNRGNDKTAAVVQSSSSLYDKNLYTDIPTNQPSQEPRLQPQGPIDRIPKKFLSMLSEGKSPKEVLNLMTIDGTHKNARAQFKAAFITKTAAVDTAVGTAAVTTTNTAFITTVGSNSVNTTTTTLPRPHTNYFDNYIPTQYLRMLKVRVPVKAIVNNMTRDGVETSIIHRFKTKYTDNSVSDSNSGSSSGGSGLQLVQAYRPRIKLPLLFVRYV